VPVRWKATVYEAQERVKAVALKESAARITQPLVVLIECQDGRLIASEKLDMIGKDSAAVERFQLLYRVCRHFDALRQPSPQRRGFGRFSHPWGLPVVRLVLADDGHSAGPQGRRQLTPQFSR